MSQYASNTSVSGEKSRGEIERTLTRYGATSFMYGWEDDRAVIGFSLEGKMIRLIIRMPDKNSDEFKLTPTGKRTRNSATQLQAWEQATRQRWRALALVVKAKLEAVESGITSVEEEFLAHILLPNGETAGAFMLPQIELAYEKGDMPTLLPELASKEK